MTIDNLKRVYFLGIGGIGMSAIAKFFISKGIEVYGYDKTAGITTQQLTEMGAIINFEDITSVIPDHIDLVIYTPAIPKTHIQFNYFLNNNYALKKRAEILGLITDGTFTVAVAGTHGKTTTSSIITHIFKQSKKSFNAFLGGLAKNYNTNFISGIEAIAPQSVIAEADEYDKSFLKLHPNIAIITAMDADHLDIYGNHQNMIDSYNDFVGQIEKEGNLIIHKNYIKLLRPTKTHIFTYNIEGDSDFYIKNLKIFEGSYHFDIYFRGNILVEDIKFNQGGLHNIENAIAAVAACYLRDINTKDINKALRTYSGVYRRFDIRIKSNNLIFIDDYAHHPQELKMFIQSVKDLYPRKKITGIFQPHLYSRTRDFANAFASSLSLLDDIILLDIYPARELPIEGITSEIILKNITSKNKMICKRENLIEEILKRNSEVFLTIGAGDIENLVLPIEKTLKNISKFL